jgi:hypothetical protein
VVDAGVIEADGPTDATLTDATLGAGAFAGSPVPLAVPSATGTDAAGTDAAGTDATGDTTPTSGWVTTDIGPDKPASVVPG